MARWKKCINFFLPKKNVLPPLIIIRPFRYFNVRWIWTDMSEPTHWNVSRYMHFWKNLKGLIIVNAGSITIELDCTSYTAIMPRKYS
jgi:hypothetical protein